MKNFRIIILLTISFFYSCKSNDTPQEISGPLKISGVYPHLAVFNPEDSLAKNCSGNGNECGIGAIVPWAGKLWMITYSPHCPDGSADKLYSIDQDLVQTIHSESVGGTPESRIIHLESNQLLIGPYLIDTVGNIRVIPPSQMPGRLTAVARHLESPENMVYYIDMEGMIYEANVYTLAVKKLFHKPIPGWHAKGGYTGQGRLVMANNGEHKVFNIKEGLLLAGGAPQSEDDIGALAEWDGKEWKIIERKQFTEVTGPGGIYGSPDEKSPLWTIGWDKRSVILKLLSKGTWNSFRLPKGTHTYDGFGGWYTEWPRIREIGGNRMLMDMHGIFYDFPKTFDANNTGGIKPVSNHLRYVPDFAEWNGQLVIATDETSILQNPYAGRSQSNLWFGSYDDLKAWGPKNAYGGPWMKDRVVANEPSVPYLINGFEKKVLHLSNESNTAAQFTLEIDKKGNHQWEEYKTLNVTGNGYIFYVFPTAFSATWIRIKSNVNCVATAFFHYTEINEAKDGNKLFQALADIEDDADYNAALIRPAAHNKNLQVLSRAQYYEADEKINFTIPAEDKSQEMTSILDLKKEFDIDEASVIIEDKSGKFRLPKTSLRYDLPFSEGWPRGKRELESERYMLNAHGTFYEVPREAGFSSMRPVATHRKKIIDYCTWRGLLVISGTRQDAAEDGHYFTISDIDGLWFGAIDDLWKLGKPVGEGGVWKNSNVKAHQASLPYLMTGYDKKKLILSSDTDATFTVEVDFDHQEWKTYINIEVKEGENVTHEFPEGFSAHWVRISSNVDCRATGWLVYE